MHIELKINIRPSAYELAKSNLIRFVLSGLRKLDLRALFYQVGSAVFC